MKKLDSFDAPRTMV